jgi:hypothetical protein
MASKFGPKRQRAVFVHIRNWKISKSSFSKDVENTHHIQTTKYQLHIFTDQAAHGERKLLNHNLDVWKPVWYRGNTHTGYFRQKWVF